LGKNPSRLHLNAQIERELSIAIMDQLKDDILDFGWLVQLARLQNPDRANSDHIRMVINCVACLHNEGKMVVGSAHINNGLVLIDPWPETSENLQRRMKRAIRDSVGDDRNYCFWIQRSDHFSG
jgi:hypothetical protein